MSNAGKQIDSQKLYEQQKYNKSAGDDKAAPALLLAGLSKPENIGAIYRLADAAGCKTIYLLNEDDAGLNRKTIQRVSRSTGNLILTISLTLKELQQAVLNWPPMIAIEITSESTSILHTELPEHCVLVIGNEKYGVMGDVLHLCTSAVHIPMYGINGSMNVSHALAIVLYEWRRQFQIAC